jgi:hypothetical protein
MCARVPVCPTRRPRQPPDVLHARAPAQCVVRHIKREREVVSACFLIHLAVLAALLRRELRRHFHVRRRSTRQCTAEQAFAPSFTAAKPPPPLPRNTPKLKGSPVASLTRASRGKSSRSGRPATSPRLTLAGSASGPTFANNRSRVSPVPT